MRKYTKRRAPRSTKLTMIQKFWSHVGDVEDCWIWTGPTTASGYGRMTDGRALRITAHRFSYLRWNGPLVDGLVLCHTCDNKLCVNPKHLVQATQLANVRDAAMKGLLGKLTWKQVREIRKRYATGGVRQGALAAEFGVGQEMISNIVNEKHWIERGDVLSVAA